MFFFSFLENSVNLCNKVLFTSEGNKQVTATVLRRICSFLSGYMWSQVCLGRQVNHHVYLQPVLGTDQTFAFPASPCVAPFSLSYSLPPYAGLPERQHAVKQHARQSKFAKEKGQVERFH